MNYLITTAAAAVIILALAHAARYWVSVSSSSCVVVDLESCWLRCFCASVEGLELNVAMSWSSQLWARIVCHGDRG
ncbi:hypothetical protein EI94DRAFT_1732408 [Lactarius quietus]|nr:hypothetical protein EI94DRAFT_1732408 [Lactarius quietus]